MTTVSTSAFYGRTGMALSALRARAEDLQAALGRGERLTAGSDDPVAAARLRTLARAEGLAAIDTTNANRAAADLTLTDTALSSFSNYVIRAKELATQAANGVLTAGQRTGIATELTQLHGELARLANTRNSAGHALFGGETSGAAYSFDALGNPLYAGTGSAGELPLGDGQSVTRGLTGPEFLNFSTAAGATNLFAVVKGLADALGGAVPDPAQAARDALGPLDTGLESITTAQTVIGARLNWIDLTTERRTQLSEQHAGEQAEIGGTDVAATVSRLQETMTVLEASQASFAKLASLSLFDLLR
ncbi:MAG: flagellar biosynthesis protein FlgL [Novosphingobium sp.]|uniref:flagellin N-terminal helical domain-containing protein n=1 Tax=Novosphingobium sp. TaxID=1874826 RepID=UPI0017CE2677|nr:flagellar biosynthesis protein FlgL [Novosphingobium sp.]